MAKVWVNTRTKKYYCAKSRFYGATKEGMYLTTSQAKAKGYKRSRQSGC